MNLNQIIIVYKIIFFIGFPFYNKTLIYLDVKIHLQLYTSTNVISTDIIMFNFVTAKS